MAPVRVLDQYYLAITLLITIGYQLSGFAIAWALQVCFTVLTVLETLSLPLISSSTRLQILRAVRLYCPLQLI